MTTRERNPILEELIQGRYIISDDDEQTYYAIFYPGDPLPCVGDRVIIRTTSSTPDLDEVEVEFREFTVNARTLQYVTLAHPNKTFRQIRVDLDCRPQAESPALSLDHLRLLDGSVLARGNTIEAKAEAWETVQIALELSQGESPDAH